MVFRRQGDRFEVILAHQTDRRTGERTTRLPKGKLDPGESPEEAAIREVEEETGLTARIVELLEELRYAYQEPRDGWRVEKQVRLYLLEHLRGEPRPADGEMEEVFWCPLEEAADRLTFPGERDAVRRAAARLGV